MKIEMHDPQGVIMREIADPGMKQKDVAPTYAFIIRQCGDAADYARINAAICERWMGRYSLEKIKRLAWQFARARG